MARYSAGFTKAAPAAGTFVSQIRTTSTKDIRVWEIGAFASTAVALSLGLIRSTTVGATFTTVTPAADDTSAGAATALVDTAITTQPTIGTGFMRKIVLPATIGAGIIWSFPMGLVVPTSAGLLLWNFHGSAAGPAVEGYWTYEE